MEKVSFPKYARSQITWKISNVASETIQRSNYSALDSGVFLINLKNQEYGYSTTKWKLRTYRNRGTLSLYLEAQDLLNASSYKDYAKLTINYEMKLKSMYGDFRNKQTGKITNFQFSQRLGKLISISDLNKRTSYQILSNKTIEVVINLDIIESKSDDSSKAQLNVSELSSQFENLYYNEKHSDFTLITVDKEEIPVHKNILSTRSPVFDRMVETKLKEGEEKKALIDDIDSGALKEFLRFLYCGRVKDIDPIAVDLLYAAEKYDLKDLKPLCVKSLTSNISLTNAIDTFILADLHSEEGLKKYCVDFILWHYEDLKRNESWLKMSVELMKEILDHSASTEKSNSCITLTSAITIAAPPVRVINVPAANPQPAVNVQPAARVNVGVNANIQPAVRIIQPNAANNANALAAQMARLAPH